MLAYIKSNEERGFTLVELLLAGALLFLIVGALYGLLVQGLETWNLSEGQIDAQRSARIAMLRIAQELRECYEVTGITDYSLTISGLQIVGEGLSTTDPERRVYGSRYYPWLSSAPPTIYKNGIPRPSSEYSVNYEEGTVTFSYSLAETDIVHADYTHDTSVIYSLSTSGILTRQVDSSSQILARYLINRDKSVPVFRTDDVNQPYQIYITLIVDKNPGELPKEYRLENECRLRK
ncbi:MAG: prepilin-type N-terminal cleavage/methylation domain-containing protein [Actinomycetota bacterium]